MKIKIASLALVMFTILSCKAQTEKLSLTPKAGKAVAVFAEGCFWCSEHVFEAVVGVDEAVSGYSGGTMKNPSYEQVGSNKTGHAEAVAVFYDPKKVCSDSTNSRNTQNFYSHLFQTLQFSILHLYKFRSQVDASGHRPVRGIEAPTR